MRKKQRGMCVAFTMLVCLLFGLTAFAAPASAQDVPPGDDPPAIPFPPDIFPIKFKDNIPGDGGVHMWKTIETGQGEIWLYRDGNLAITMVFKFDDSGELELVVFNCNLKGRSENSPNGEYDQYLNDFTYLDPDTCADEYRGRIA